MPLKTVSLVQDLQPQYAAFLAITAAARHSIPTTGDHVLTVDVGGGLQAEQAVNDLLASDAIVSGDVACERSGPTLELLSSDVKRLNEIAATITSDDGAVVDVVDSILLEEVSFDYANLVNRARKGALVVAGDSLLTLECKPASQTGVLANRIESDHSGIDLVNIDLRSGRVILKGSAPLLKSIQAN